MIPLFRYLLLSCLQGLLYALLAMADIHLYAELLMDVFGEMLGRINAAVLAACASEGEHQIGESTVDISLNVCVGKLIDAVEEGEYLSVVLKEADDRFVQSGELLVRLVSSRIVSGTTVEDVASAIAGRILRNALTEREAEHSHTQRTLTVILREGGWSVLRM